MTKSDKDVLCTCPLCKPSDFETIERHQHVMRHARRIRITERGPALPPSEDKVVILYSDWDMGWEWPC
jgi:hypothetical protein